MDSPVAELSPTQRTVLATLKRLGEATADELATKLDISASAVRQHLGVLLSADVVATRQQRGLPGRPASTYHATPKSEALFSSSDTKLSIEILAQVEQEDPALIARIFDRRSSQLVEIARERLAGKPVDECIDIVAELLDEQGYLADFVKVEAGHYHLNLHSCAIWPVANRFRQACTAELAFITDLLPDTTVDRITHKTAGAHTCTYDIHIAS